MGEFGKRPHDKVVGFTVHGSVYRGYRAGGYGSSLNGRGSFSSEQICNRMSGTWTDEILALAGEPVFLEATVGFVGQSSFDESEIRELIHAVEPQAEALDLVTIVEEGHADGRATVRACRRGRPAPNPRQQSSRRRSLS